MRRLACARRLPGTLERMSTARRVSIAAAASAASVAAIFALLTVYPIPTVGAAFAVVGLPLGELIFRAAPNSFVRELAPQGGPDAIGWAMTLGALLTWFALLFAVWFVVLGRMRSNSTPHSDARANAVLDQPPSARAGERGR